METSRRQSFTRRKAFWLWLLCAWGGLVAPAAAPAAEPTFSTQQFVHSAERQSLRDVLKAFAASQGWSLTLGAGMEEPLSARFAMSPSRFWEFITNAHNLQWYFDGQDMHVTAASDKRTEVLPMGSEAYQRFVASLAQLNITDRRFPVRFDGNSGVAVLSGPPRFVELAASVSQHLETDQGRDSELVTKVIRLKAALAADTTVRVGHQDVRMEGLASVVRRVMGIDGAVAQAERTSAPSPILQSPEGTTRMGSVRKLQMAAGAPTSGSSSSGEALNIFGQPLPSSPPPAAAERSAPTLAPARPVSRVTPRVEADAGINAIIVRDRAARLPDYLALIHELDQARPLIEIEARMIEVERGELEELGIDWNAGNSRGSVSVQNGGDTSARAPQIVTSLVGNAVTQLLAKVRALESVGRAKVVMTPRVLTVDNTEAVIENTETAYVRVSGNLEANLYSVSAGSALRILPAVLSNEEPRRVRLVVTLEDGVFAPASVDNVPVVQRSRIFTQSEIGDGATLVVGGMSDVRERSAKDAVPGLSRLPALGALFSSRSATRSSRERLYMVTPRIVTSPSTAAASVRPASDTAAPATPHITKTVALSPAEDGARPASQAPPATPAASRSAALREPAAGVTPATPDRTAKPAKRADPWTQQGF